MDSTAVALCRENGLPIRVFKMAPGNIKRVCSGEEVGTIVARRLRRQSAPPAIGRRLSSPDSCGKSLPEFGTGVLYAILVCAAYTFAVALAAGSGTSATAARGAPRRYATSALIGLGVLMLAYAFVTHDFRISLRRPLQRPLDEHRLSASPRCGAARTGRSSGGRSCSSLYITACVRWLQGRYRQLQPYVIATLMVVIVFFAVLMLFAANPFSTANIAGAQPTARG